MSLLTTFGILFDTSSAEESSAEVSDLNRSLDQTSESANNAVDNVNKANDSARDAGNGYNLFSKGIGSVIAGMTALIPSLSAAAIASGMLDVEARTDALGKFTETLGLNAAEVEAWSKAVVISGGDANAFIGSISSLNSALTTLELTGGGAAAEVLARLGISATDSAGDIRSAMSLVPEIADAFAGLSKTESYGFGQMLGFDQGTINLLQKGSASVLDLVAAQGKLSGLTSDDLAAAADLQDAFANLTTTAEGLLRDIATDNMPTILGYIETVHEAAQSIRDNAEDVKEFMEAFDDFGSGVGAAIYDISEAFKTIAADLELIDDPGTLFSDDTIQNASAFADALIGVYEVLSSIGDIIGGGLFDLTSWFSGLTGIDADIQANVQAANATVAAANANPLNSVTNVSSTSAASYTTNNINVGGATINAQGTSAEEVRKQYAQHLYEQLDDSIGQYDDGVSY